MAELQAQNYALNKGSTFCLGDRGSNNAEILVAHDWLDIEVGSDPAAADTIRVFGFTKNTKILNVRIFSAEDLGGAAEFSVGAKANGKELLADDAAAFITSANLSSAGKVEMDAYSLLGKKLEADLEVMVTVVAPTVVAAKSRLHVIVEYINE